MRREARGWRPLSSERGGGKTGSAAQNLPRFSSVATTVPERAACPPEWPDGLPDPPAGLPLFAGFPALVGSPDLPALAGLPDFFPLDPPGELT